MRFMVIVKASSESETGAMPAEQELREMGALNEELVKAGMMLAGEGLHPTKKGARIRFEGQKPTVSMGPFGSSKELVAGFWILQAKSQDEVLDWMKRAPFKDGELEIRQVFETEDFAASDPTGELRAQEHRLRAETERLQPRKN